MHNLYNYGVSYPLATLREYFLKLDLTPDIADLYLALYTKGPQSISDLSRNSGIERTRIYRMLEELQENALVEVESHYKRKLLKAVPPSNLQLLFSKKEQQLVELQNYLPTLERMLSKDLTQTVATKIQFYHGADGAKQLLWNETRATTEIEAILYENIQIKTGEKFFDRWVNRCNERKLNFRGIVSDSFLKSQADWYSTHINERLKKWTPRYIQDNVFPISHTTVIYDNVVAYYNWQDNEIFGIEIYNQEIADSQRNIFELLWDQAEVRSNLQ